MKGKLAQLARALHYKCRGRRFESGTFHEANELFASSMKFIRLPVETEC